MFDKTILAFGLILWALQYWFAYTNGWLLPSQMRQQFPGESILPLVWHGGIWFDLPLTFYIAWLSNRHQEWSGAAWCTSLTIGFIASYMVHHMVYAPATGPNLNPLVVVTQESHVHYGKVSIVGTLHMAFFGLILAAVINEVVFSKDPSLSELILTSVVLVVLLFVGNHMVLGIIKEVFKVPFDYRGEPLKSMVGWVTISGGAGIAAFVCVARGVYHIW